MLNQNGGREPGNRPRPPCVLSPPFQGPLSSQPISATPDNPAPPLSKQSESRNHNPQNVLPCRRAPSTPTTNRFTTLQSHIKKQINRNEINKIRMIKLPAPSLSHEKSQAKTKKTPLQEKHNTISIAILPNNHHHRLLRRLPLPPKNSKNRLTIARDDHIVHFVAKTLMFLAILLRISLLRYS